MKKPFALALVFGLGSLNVAPASDRLDAPGPGYRLQREIYAPREGKSISFLQITPSLFLHKTFLPPGSLRADKPIEPAAIATDNPFSEPIRLFPIPDGRY